MKRFSSPLAMAIGLACLATLVPAQITSDKTPIPPPPTSPKNTGHWNQFRGPHGNGTTIAKNLPSRFNETTNLRWKTAIHGEGWSSPVVWDNQIWVTTAKKDGTKLFVICVDLKSGKVVHDIKVFDVAKPATKYAKMNSHASPTPVIEAGRIYVHYGSPGTACLDTRSGKKIWERRDLKCDHRVRAGSSPIIAGKALFLTFDGVDAQYIVALDKLTGKTIWRRDRENKETLVDVLKGQGFKEPSAKKTAKEKPNDHKKAYGTPTIITHKGKGQLISPAAMFTIAYEPTTGKEIWRVRHPGMGWNGACRPLYHQGLVFFISGISKLLLAVRPDGSGDVTDTHVVWRVRKSTPNIPSPLIADGWLFMVSDSGGAVSCLEVKTGKEIFRERLKTGGQHWASPVYADNKIYYCSKGGVVSVFSLKDFKYPAHNRFDSGFIASPAITGDALILRSLTHLYCVAETTKK